MKNQLRKGFTLIELVVVIAVLAILAGVAIPKFIDVTQKAKESALQADLGVVRSGILMVAAEKAASGTKLSAAYPADLGKDNGSLVFGTVLEPAAQADFYTRGWRSGDGLTFTNTNYTGVTGYPAAGVVYASGQFK